MPRYLLLLSLLALTACPRPTPTGGSDAEVAGPADAEAPDAATPGPDAGADAGPDASSPDVGSPDVGPSFAWKEARGLVHMHSPYSHDGCDNQGLTNGVPNSDCLSQLRAAPCQTGLDFVELTDHPANMQDYSMQEDLLYNAGAGDELLMGPDGPIGNVMTCSDGHKVLLTVGFESTHTLPLGLRKQPVGFYGPLVDTMSVADSQALVAGLKAAGAVVGIAHSEETDLSAQRIVESGVDAMEWYNPHGNFMKLMGGDTLTGDPLGVLSVLKSLEPFLLGSSSGAQADLVYLLVLTQLPIEGFDKWQQVNQSRAVTGMLGTDCHRNVSVDPVCTGYYAYACQAAAQAYPNALTLAVNGGKIVLSDGDRLDSYARLMRWLENRIYVTAVTPDGIAEALRAGRGYGLFTVFGAPEGFGFWGRAGQKDLFLGESATGSARLFVQAPRLPTALRGVQFNAADAASAEIRTQLLRIDASGTQVVREVAGLAASIDEQVTAPGAYFVEVWIRPKHLKPYLGSQGSFGDEEYLWLITNPIHLQ